jgi:hypothetical protein
VKRLGLCAVLLAVAPIVAAAQPVEGCLALPTEAQRPRACNPRSECLSQVTLRFQGRSSFQDTQKNCQRMPTSGTCYGPETYNPQAECLARQRR